MQEPLGQAYSGQGTPVLLGPPRAGSAAREEKRKTVPDGSCQDHTTMLLPLPALWKQSVHTTAPFVLSLGTVKGPITAL